jgi:hypothetical protein
MRKAALVTFLLAGCVQTYIAAPAVDIGPLLRDAASDTSAMAATDAQASDGGLGADAGSCRGIRDATGRCNDERFVFFLDAKLKGDFATGKLLYEEGARLCQERADREPEPALLRGRIWSARIADGAVAAEVTALERYAGTWVSPDRAIMFQSGTPLSLQKPSAPFETADGMRAADDASAWTGLTATGSASGFSCSNWQNGGSGAGAATQGTYGLVATSSTSTAWTSTGTSTCSVARGLYCFEVP